jgi:acetylornithine deacetylase
MYYGKPALAYGPTGANFHGHDEYVNLGSVMEITKVIARFIMDWCGVAS